MQKHISHFQSLDQLTRLKKIRIGPRERILCLKIQSVFDNEKINNMFYIAM